MRDDKTKRIDGALGMPPGSIRALLALGVIWGTTLAFLILVGHAVYVGSAQVLVDVIDGGAVWFGVVTAIVIFYYNTGQSTDSMKDMEKLIKEVVNGKPGQGPDEGGTSGKDTEGTGT